MPPALPPPTLEVFYSPTCVPCRLELPVLAEVAGRRDVRVRIVILDQEERARAELRAVSPALEAVAEGPSAVAPAVALHAAGNANGILPYVRLVAQAGTACARWAGRLTVARVESLLDACARFRASPPHPPS